MFLLPSLLGADYRSRYHENIGYLILRHGPKRFFQSAMTTWAGLGAVP